jgi:aminoglycoside/choline kinase family phosphotransferase
MATMDSAAAELDPRIGAFLAERRGPAAAAVQVTALSGDASTRRYYRLTAPEGTAILSLHLEPFDAEHLPFIVMRHLMAGWGIPVPAILDQDGPRGILVLEDLGDLTLQEALRGASARQREEFYRTAVDQLVTLQREAARGPRRAPCFQVTFDIEKLAWELHYFFKHFLEGHRGANLSVEDRSVLSGGFHRLSAEIASWPRVLCHRDYHSRNLMRHGDRLLWIDFQDARMGPATYDLVSLLRDSYVDVEEEFQQERAEEFRQKALPREHPEVFRRRFDLMSVQRNLKALGTFGYQASVKGNRVYLPYIPRTLANARRNLSRYPELGPVWRVLANHIKELR